MIRRIPVILAAAFVLLAVGEGDRLSRAQRATLRAEDMRASPQRLIAGGIENLYRLSPRLLSGGQPEGDAGFAALKGLGVKTVISVDGAVPDLGRAKRFGLRYVHLPVGYDGISREQALRLIKAVQTLPHPVYIHCHHGKHRGPTAAGLCGMGTEQWSQQQALAWLSEAGTAPEYRGLFETIRTFTLPTERELEEASGAFAERAHVSTFVEAMVEIDGLWDRIKLCREAGFRSPRNHPDIDPPHEVLQLAEQFREALRSDHARQSNADFRTKLRAAERAASTLHASLASDRDVGSQSARTTAEAGFQQMTKTCTACHATFRDNSSPKN